MEESVIKFDDSDLAVISDDAMIGKAETGQESTPETNVDMDTINDDANCAGGTSTGDDGRDNQNEGQAVSNGGDEDLDISEAENNLEDLTYYPGIRRSKRGTDGEPLQRYGYNQANVIVENSTAVEGVQESYSDTMGRSDARKLHDAMKLEIESQKD